MATEDRIHGPRFLPLYLIETGVNVMDKVIAVRQGKSDFWTIALVFSNGNTKVLRTLDGHLTFTTEQKTVLVRMWWERGFTPVEA